MTERLLGGQPTATSSKIPEHTAAAAKRMWVHSPFPSTSNVSMKIARRPETAERAAQPPGPRKPKTMLLGVDRFDYTKGIDVRLRAYTELLQEKRLDPTKPCWSGRHSKP